MFAARTDLLAVLPLLALTSCAAHAPERPPAAPPAAAETVAHGRGYTVPIPSGFGQVKEGIPEQMKALLEGGGVILAELRRPALDAAFLASLVIAPMPPLRFDPGDEAVCDTIAGEMSSMAGVEVQGTRVVTLKVGKTCQWEAKATDHPGRGAKGTLIPGPSAWMVICNYDLRDPVAQEGCDQLLNGFEFTSRDRAAGVLD